MKKTAYIFFAALATLETLKYAYLFTEWLQTIIDKYNFNFLI